LFLKEKYDDTCIVTNYAVSGCPMLKKCDFPLWNEPDFAKGWAYAPDICFIMLGTNDSKPYNWDDHKDDFYSDYKAMIDTFTARNPLTKFILCLPPPAFAVVWDIRNPIIANEIIPLIDSLAKTTGADVIDFYKPLLDSVQLLPDKIHPNAKGAKVLAKIAFDKIVSSDIIHEVRTGGAFVTTLKSSVTGELRLSDKVTLSWTTLNANEVFLNGEKVDLNGSILRSPTETTNYTLVAKGDLTNDLLTLVQKMYILRLAKFTASASTRSMFVGDTSKLKMIYYDQNSRLITDSIFAVNWSLTEGSGHFVNQGDNTIQFVGDAVGTAKLLGSFRTLNFSIAINIKAFPTGVELENSKSVPEVYPNPFEESLFLSIPAERQGKLSIRLFDSAGRLCKTYSIQISGSLNHSIEMLTSDLEEGLYIYKLELSGESYSGSVLKRNDH